MFSCEAIGKYKVLPVYKTAFVKRPQEWGNDGPPDPVPNSIHDLVVDDFPSLAEALGVTI